MPKKSKKEVQAKPPEKRKKINSRAKGATNERAVAKILGEWWGEKFSKTPASGGLHWKEDNRVSGDIVPPPNSTFPFSVECKKVEGWDFSHLLNNIGKFPGWWGQCTHDALDVSKRPLLTFTKNRDHQYYMLYFTDWEKLGLDTKPHFVTRLKTEYEDGAVVAVGLLADLTKLEPSFLLEKMDLN